MLKALSQATDGRLTGVDSAREDPRPGGDSSLNQAFSEHLLEFGLQVEVLQAPVHGDEQRGQLQLPVLHHQVQQVVGLGVIADPDVL